MARPWSGVSTVPTPEACWDISQAYAFFAHAWNIRTEGPHPRLTSQHRSAVLFLLLGNAFLLNQHLVFDAIPHVETTQVKCDAIEGQIHNWNRKECQQLADD